MDDSGKETQHEAHTAMLLALPEALLQHDVIPRLESSEKGALRGTCKSLKARADAYITSASWEGATDESGSCPVPPNIQHVDICAYGPVSQSWLHGSLCPAQNLQTLHLAAPRGFGQSSAEVAVRRKARAQLATKTKDKTWLEGCCLAAVKTLAEGAWQGGSLRELFIQGEGLQLKPLTEINPRLVEAVLVPHNVTAALSRLESLCLSLPEVSLPYPLYTGIIFQLSSLRSLDLSGTSFGHVPSLGLHPLSRLEVLDHLSLRGCEQLHPSNLMTLYLCRSLTDLDLSFAKILDVEDGVRLLPDPALLRRKGDDRAAVTEQVMQLNGWDRASMPHATSAVLTQLGRCKRLQRLNLREAIFPSDDRDDWEQDDILVGRDLLGPLASSLTDLDLSELELMHPDLEVLSQLTRLTRLEYDHSPEDLDFTADEMIYALKEVLPSLAHLSLRGANLVDASQWHWVSTMTQLTFLDLSYMDPGSWETAEDMDEEASLKTLLLHFGSACASTLRFLSLEQCPLSGTSLIPTLFTSLTSLTLDQVYSSGSEWRPAEGGGWDGKFLTAETCQGLSGLEELSAMDTYFDLFCLANVLRHCPRLKRLHASGCFPDAKLTQMREAEQEAVQQGQQQPAAHGQREKQAAPQQGKQQQGRQGQGALQGEGAQAIQEGGSAHCGASGVSSSLAKLESLQPHTSLTELDLSCEGYPGRNRPGDDGLHVLTGLLPNLRWLGVAGSHLTSAGWQLLGRQLPSLTSLDVTGTHISDADLKTLVASQAQAHPHAPETQQQGTSSTAAPGPLFPFLKTLAVTDVVKKRLQVTPAGINAVAEAAQSGRCSLRIIAIEERLPRSCKVCHRHMSDDEDDDGGSTEYDDSDEESDSGSSGSWTSASEGAGAGEGQTTQQGGGGSAAGASGNNNSNNSGEDRFSSASSDSEWEEVKPEQEALTEDVSAAIQQRVQVAQASRILVAGRCAEWQRAGLLIRRYSDFREDFGRHRFRRDRMA